MLKISNDGVVYLIFTKEMRFPPDMKELLNLEYAKSSPTEFDFIDRRLLSEE